MLPPLPVDSRHRPRLLFVAPTYPDTSGNGLAMRAGLFVQALAQHHRVTLLVVPLFGKPTRSSDELIQGCCEETIVVPTPSKAGAIDRLREQFASQPALVRAFARYTRACIDAVGARRFDVIHAFRLYMAPIALALAARYPDAGRPAVHLDLDDMESVTARRMAEVRRWNQEHERAERERREAQRFEKVEQRLLPAFDRVYVSSEVDAERVRPLVRGDLRVAPNAVHVPSHASGALTTHPFTFLFVGNQAYYPNEDAVRFFCRRVLPLIRQTSRHELLFRVVGAEMSPHLQHEAAVEGVRLLGYVEDVSPEYADADAVVVPIRGGGGTRIKVLEAFAHCRPVVSTPMGIEGIEAKPKEHYLLGETPETFADQCVRLMDDREFGSSIAERAYKLVSERYSYEAFARILAG